MEVCSRRKSGKHVLASRGIGSNTSLRGWIAMHSLAGAVVRVGLVWPVVLRVCRLRSRLQLRAHRRAGIRQAKPHPCRRVKPPRYITFGQSFVDVTLGNLESLRKCSRLVVGAGPKIIEKLPYQLPAALVVLLAGWSLDLNPGFMLLGQGVGLVSRLGVKDRVGRADRTSFRLNVLG